VAVKKKREAKAKKGGLREDDPAEEKAASTKAKPKKVKQVKAPVKRTVSAVSKSKVTAESGGQRKVRVRGAVAVGRNDPGETAEQEQDPFEVAKRTMKGSVPAIVEAMVELAKQGSCSHAKTLLEMTGAKHMFDGEAQDNSEPWAKLVLERLDEAELKAEQETISAQTESLREAE
jgi:hypothetical protein